MFTIVAGSWFDGRFALRVLADDGREVWGEDLPADSFDTIPHAADVRLIPTAYRRVGDWVLVETGRFGPYADILAPAWRAAAEVPE